MKLDDAKMLILIGEDKYIDAIKIVADYFCLVVPACPKISLIESCRYHTTVQIWMPRKVYEWSSGLGFESVSRGTYYYDNTMGPFRIYKNL